jgi:hypothetical protein
MFVRTTNDPSGQIAHALCEFCVQPFRFSNPRRGGSSAASESPRVSTVDLPGMLAVHAGSPPDPSCLRQRLFDDPPLLGRILAEIGTALPFTPVLVLDQVEEIFTLVRGNVDESGRGLVRETLRRSLELLRELVAADGDFKVILALRTEYQGRLVDVLRDGEPTDRVREYLLTDFDEGQLAAAIERPTLDVPIEHAREIPRRKYRFTYGDDLPRLIAAEALAAGSTGRDSVLPLLQVVCVQLYDRARAAMNPADPEAMARIGVQDLLAIGGVRGGWRPMPRRLCGGSLHKGRTAWPSDDCSRACT